MVEILNWESCIQPMIKLDPPDSWLSLTQPTSHGATRCDLHRVTTGRSSEAVGCRGAQWCLGPRSQGVTQATIPVALMGRDNRIREKLGSIFGKVINKNHNIGLGSMRTTTSFPAEVSHPFSGTHEWFMMSSSILQRHSRHIVPIESVTGLWFLGGSRTGIFEGSVDTVDFLRLSLNL